MVQITVLFLFNLIYLYNLNPVILNEFAYPSIFFLVVLTYIAFFVKNDKQQLQDSNTSTSSSTSLVLFIKNQQLVSPLFTTNNNYFWLFALILFFSRHLFSPQLALDGYNIFSVIVLLGGFIIVCSYVLTFIPELALAFEPKQLKNVVNNDNSTELTVNKSNSTGVAVKQSPIKPLVKNPSTSGMSFTFLTKSYSTSATSVDFIPWIFTPHLIQGQKALIDCFNDVKVKNLALHTFLVKECSELVELQESSPSYIPIDLLTPPISGLVSLGKIYSITKIKACESLAGCYALTKKEVFYTLGRILIT
jgi:hypothetical protein